MKRLIAYLLSYLSTPLPVGMVEFKEWSDSILILSKVPDNDSTRFAIAVMIMHLNPDVDSVPKREMVRRLNKSAANEIANAVCLQLKEKQKEVIAEEARKKAEATGLSNGSNSGNSHDNQVEKL